MGVVLHYDRFLPFIEQLLKYCALYGKIVLGLVLYAGYASFMWIFEKICYLSDHYPYISYALMAFCIWLPFSPIVVRNRPRIQLYAKKSLAIFFMIITFPFWFWWLLPLRAYQKYKFNKELDSFQ